MSSPYLCIDVSVGGVEEIVSKVIAMFHLILSFFYNKHLQKIT